MRMSDESTWEPGIIYIYIYIWCVCVHVPREEPGEKQCRAGVKSDVVEGIFIDALHSRGGQSQSHNIVHV